MNKRDGGYMKPGRRKMIDSPRWLPEDPYPIELCSIKTDRDLARAIPDENLRSAVAWYLYGCGFRLALNMTFKKLKEYLDMEQGG